MSLISRGFAAFALLAATAGTLAPPAAAAHAAAPQLSVRLPDMIVGEDSNGKSIFVFVRSSEPVRATHLTLQIDSSGLAGIATVALESSDTHCNTSTAVITCQYEERFLSGSTNVSPRLVVNAVAGVAAGAGGKWKATISADGLAAASTEATVKVGEAVDLAVPIDHVSVKSTPGGTIPQRLAVDNIGEVTADGAVAIFHGDYAVTTAKQYSNCTFVDGSMRSCTFDEQLETGKGYTTEAIPFKLRQDTLAPGLEFLSVTWMTKDDFILAKQAASPDFFGQPGSGDKLALVTNPQVAARAPQTEINPSDNSFGLSVSVEGDNDSDRAAIGGSASGTAGQVVTLSLGVRNLGPATTDHSSVLGFATADVTLPQGSSLTEMPEDCIAMTSIGELGERDRDSGNLAARFIRCEHPNALFLAGTEVTFPVKLRIDQVLTGSTGTVAVLTKGCDGCREDKNPANDTATVLLNAATLPTTGVQTGLIAGAGVLLALLGAAFFILGRRRSKITEETA